MVQAKKPLVIPVFIPHSGCPHQCAFCNQSIITSQKSSLPDKIAIHHIVSQYLQYKGTRELVELAFFGGNFLGLPHDTIIQLLDMVQPYIKEKKNWRHTIFHPTGYHYPQDTGTCNALQYIYC